MLGGVLRGLFRLAVSARLAGTPQELVDPAPVLVVANHPGAWDALILMGRLPPDTILVVPPLAKASWALRVAIRSRRVVPMDLSLASSVRRLARLVAQYRRVAVFPENRVMTTGSAGKFYEAPAIVAARSGVQVVPVNLRYGNVGARGRTRLGVTITVGTRSSIVLPSGLPARERRRQANDCMLAIMQRCAVEARPRETLYEAFLGALRQNGRHTRILEDQREIEESYGSLLRMTLALSRLLGRCTQEGSVVGLMLPNTAAAVAALLGLSAIRRVPAMLNYSSGPDAVRNSASAAGLQVVVTSRRFVEVARLERLVRALGQCRIVYLEDLRAELRLSDKAWLACWALWQPGRVAIPSRTGDVALVLFTSGSEGKPKGVALSHDAVLANMAQMAAVIDFDEADKFLNALPMYHTYGLIACTLMPLFYGTRLFLYVNPLHYRIIPEIAYSRGCTYLFGTSTFLGNYAKQARPMDFRSLRYVISGGEKLNPEVQRIYQERFGLRVFEGYGSTECGPAVSLSTRHGCKPGTVGRFLPCVVHALEPVEGIAEGGLLHLKTPNLMLGYLLHDRPGEVQPSGSVLGPEWHCMGDVVSVDVDGYVSVLGRLKRFAKVAGEMVALEAVERLARACSPEHQHAASVAMSPDRGESTVLFTTDPALDRARLHQAARASGAQDLAVARTIVHVADLPVLGNGKTDYVRLSDLARSAAAEPVVQSIGGAGVRAGARSA